MKEERKTGTIIIGAGLTGLSLAHYLRKAGEDFLVVEKSGHTGGVIQTHSEDGFTWESGPNTGVLGNPEIAELFEDLHPVCELETARPESKKRLIWKDGDWHPLPSDPLTAVKTPLFRFRDKVRILGEPFRKRGTDPMESVAELVRRRMGESFLDYAVDPFISGIYAGDPEKLITRYALPKLYNLEMNYGSFIRGAMKKKAEGKSERDKKATKEVFSAKGGLKNLIKALENSAGAKNIYTGCRDLKITREEDHYLCSFTTGEQRVEVKAEAERVVNTAGAQAVSDFLKFMKKKEIKPVGELKYARVVQVVLGFREWKGMKLDAFGGLVPSRENRNILGVLFPSAIFKNRAPEGGALLSVFAGGTRNKYIIELSDKRIIQMVFEELEEMFALKDIQPDILKIYRYEYAIPQYTSNSGERFEAIAELEKRYPGLYLAGNMRNGIGMADRVKQAKEISEQVINGKNA